MATPPLAKARPGPNRKAQVIGIVLALIIGAGFIAVVNPFREIASSKAEAEVWSDLKAGQQNMRIAYNAWNVSWPVVEEYALRAHADFLAAQRTVNDHRDVLTAEDQRLFDELLKLRDGLAQFNVQVARLTLQKQQAGQALQSAADGLATSHILAEYEVLAEGYDHVARSYDDLTNSTARLVQDEPDLARQMGAGDELVTQMREGASSLHRNSAALSRFVAERGGSGYVPIANHVFEPDRALHPNDPAFTPAVRTLFDGFDKDGSGALSVGEAKAFFYWVEKNIHYRYDDENYPNPNPGYPVGDGRPGRDYHQTPQETITELYGDCEDMNGLELAFYIYWGITAVQAYVNAQSASTADHAIALVYVGLNRTAANQVIGQMASYTFAEGQYPDVKAGVYMLIDNAYSETFGYISGGMDPGKFQIYQIIQFGGAFDRETT